MDFFFGCLVVVIVISSLSLCSTTPFVPSAVKDCGSSATLASFLPFLGFGESSSGASYRKSAALFRVRFDGFAETSSAIVGSTTVVVSSVTTTGSDAILTFFLLFLVG